MVQLCKNMEDGDCIFFLSKSGIIVGAENKIIKVETFIGNGLPSFYIIGLPDATVRESKERIRSALKSVDKNLPPKRIVVNLSPANIKKSGSHFDLPIAYNLLKLTEREFKKEVEEKIALVGELSLSGEILPIKGILSFVDGFKKNNIEKVIIPYDNYEEACFVRGIEIIPLKNLYELITYIKSGYCFKPKIKKNILKTKDYTGDYSEVYGQEFAKRALVIAISGRHNILFMGSPGVGKSMIAKRIPSILDKLDYEEAIEVGKIFSISGKDGLNIVKTRKRPFRNPHHSITKSALVGGGFKPSPGEISFAHNGVLFLDELLEFQKDSLDILREPLEEKTISISRINGDVKYPANFLFVGAMNPCKCGYFGSSRKQCVCKSGDVKNYLKKISGPMLDRISILVKMNEVKIQDYNDSRSTSTEEMTKDILIAKEIQKKRYKNKSIKYNGELKDLDIKKYCKLTDEAKIILEKGYGKLNLSLRSYNNLIKIARTIADLDEFENINEEHILEAMQFRKMEKFITG